jgi:hypothetical protein
MNLNESSDSIFVIGAIALFAFSFGYGFLSPYLKKKGVSEHKILLIVKGSVVVILLAGTYAYRNVL